jgi:hypothetical protein
MSIPTTTRNATLGDLAEMLQRQHDLKLDAVVPATAIHSDSAMLSVKGLSVLDDAVTLRPTEICDGHIADRLGIPAQYLRKLRFVRPDLYDANVNGWIHGTDSSPSETLPLYSGPDDRSFLLRTFSDPDGGEGIARALLSNSFGIVDNLDVLMACLKGVKESGVDVHVVRCELSERRMNVRFAAPSISKLAPTLLKDYRSPISEDRWLQYAERHHIDNPDPTVPLTFAGFDLGNSETGGGAFTIKPVLTVLQCLNGMVLPFDQLRKVHLGAKMDQGIIRWSVDTQRKNMELVSAQAIDAVRTYLDVDYVAHALSKLEEKSGAKVADVVKTIEFVSKQLKFTEDEQAGILDHFIRGGAITAGGVLQAVTSYAQEVDDPDEALNLEESAVRAMELAAAV